MFSEIQNIRDKGLKIGFTSSAFDLLTPGHVYMLEIAKSKCDYLVVGLLSYPTIDRPDTKNKPIQTLLERFIQLQAIKGIDLIVPFDTEKDLETIIKMIEPDIRIVGKEYEGTEHTGWNLCPIYYNKRNNHFSSTEIRNRIAKLIEKK